MNSIDIFLERMANIIFLENRPFCYKDFLSFELNGKEHRYTHGTIRNNFSTLKKQNSIEFVCQSPEAFYTLKGVNQGKSITPNHGEAYLHQKQKTFLTFLNQLPMDKPAIHDIRLRFSVRGLWDILSSLSSSSTDLISNIDVKNNKDITLHDIDLKDHVIKTTIHKTDTVSVIIACSNTPIPLDTMGLAKLSSALTRVEDRLQRLLIDHYTSLNAGLVSECNNRAHTINIPSKYSVPSHMLWTVTMWHFGQDSLIGYSGEKFEIQWKDGLQLFHMYSKQIHNKKTFKKIIRKEIQEYPNRSLEDSFRDKIE